MLIPQVMDIKRINWRDGKYLLPAILYFPLLGVGYLIIDIFHTEKLEVDDGHLQTTTYLNDDLPQAMVDDIGGKRENMQKSFGDMREITGVENIEDDRDSLVKKEEYHSSYSDAERDSIAEAERLKKDQERFQEYQRRLSGGDGGGGRRRGRNAAYDDLESDLGLDYASVMARRDSLFARLGILDSPSSSPVSPQAADSVPSSPSDATADQGSSDAVHALEDGATVHDAVKSLRKKDSHFNTLSRNESSNRLIRAIIDEELKAVDGSRVRLRLLDDIIVDDIVIRKGTYLYATMSGFGSQRVKGKVESVLVDDEIFKVSLNIYDMDGLEGLYVPQSQFRETSKEVMGSMLDNNLDATDGMTSRNSVSSWAVTGIQNAIQRTSQALSKSVRKNKVRLKYGTQVYLINGNQSQKRSQNK